MMLKILCSSFLLLTFHLGFGHDIKMAIFEIYQGKSGLEMTVSLDKEDFLKTLATEFAPKFNSENLEELALDYLASKIAIEVNGGCTSFTIHEIEYGDLNIHIKGSLNIQATKVAEVRMSNTCMIDLFKGHDNIMKLKLNDRTRSFRLNSSRTSTIATY